MESLGTHWIALYVNGNNMTYFDSFWVEHIPKEIIKLNGKETITTNTYIIQAYDSIMCRYFCIRFIDFILKDIRQIYFLLMIMKRIIKQYYNIFNNKKMKILYCAICSKNRKFEKPKISYLLKKTLFMSIICKNVKNVNVKV